jgi:hypothetical protein
MSTAVTTKTMQELTSELASAELYNQQLLRDNKALVQQVANMVRTLRDEFAAAALGGICSCLVVGRGDPMWSLVASDAYAAADAMMRERML